MSTQNTINQTLQNTQSLIADFLNSNNATESLSIAFGNNFSLDTAINLLESLANGDVAVPIEVISSSQINHANGAFSSTNNTIYLASELLASNDLDAVTKVLLEETGHYLDSIVNSSDAPGDEGAIFASLVLGEELDSNQLQLLQAEDDTAIVNLDGAETVIEQDSVIYVKADATGENTGTSWNNAYTDLQSALAVAGNGDQIWVADGTYVPTTDGDREVSFVIPSGVQIYGGFSGVGEQSLAERDYENNITILSGNIGDDTAGDNSYHVVDITGTTASTVLDGLTIRDGNANGEGGFDRQDDGAGLFSRENSGAILRNLIITNNVATGDGGALYLESNNSPTIINVTFNNNSASDEGGAIYVDSNDSLNIFNSLFVDNQSSGGGAIHTRFLTTLNVINSTFYNNQGGEADSIFDDSSFGNYDRTISNNIFWDNSPTNSTQVFLDDFTSDVNLTVSNNIVKGTFPLPGEGDIVGEGNLTEDPLFVNPDNNDFRLQLTSPGINAGNNDAINLDTDILGNPRIFNNTVDIGAYEYGVLMSIDDVTLTEGDDGTTNADFTVTLLDSLGQPATEEITVNYSTVDDTASAGSDYTFTSGTLTFNVGDTTKTVSVPVNGDELIEPTERFGFELSGLTGNAVIVDSQGFATITNDDQQRKITIADAAIGEGNQGEQAIEFTLSLDRSYVQDITVDYNVVENTATPGGDYIDIDGTVTFEPGETEQTISVLVNGDTNFESNETFFVQLSNPSDNATIEDEQATGTINNDDEQTTPVIEPEDRLDTNINRFQNTAIPGTYLFAGEGESESIRENATNFEEEGLAFQVAVEPGDDLIPLYRFQSTRNPGTYVFVGEGERENINANFSEDFNEEGLAFYVYGSDSGIGTTFYRFQNSDRPGTYLFAGPSEREAILENAPNFIEEGPAFNVGG